MKSKVIKSSKKSLTKEGSKRAGYVKFPGADVIARINRACSERLYLVEADDNGIEGVLSRTYTVLGSTGNVYDVIIQEMPSCTCPDFQRCYVCKHILFVLIKVLQEPRHSPLIYQKFYLESELLDLFSRSNRSLYARVKASDDIVAAYDAIRNNATDDTANIDSDCPICFETMLNCQEELDKCHVCKKFIHNDCLKRWLNHSNTCCYCRSAWIKNTIGGSYVNLGRLQSHADELL